MGEVMEKIKLRLANLNVEFVDREQALERVREWAERGMVNVQVIYGPEGCGKTAWLRQSVELLRELGFDVIYLNPVEREFAIETGIKDVKERLLEILREATDESWARAVWALIDLGRELIRVGRRKIAVLADDVFQAIGLGKAAIYVKGLLGILEYPPGDYDVAITIAATSEGLSRYEIGRHRWADLLAMWNMPREGFRQLYDQLPGNKPDLEEVWKLTGGNPKMLAELYQSNWRADEVIRSVISGKMITKGFTTKWRKWLEKAVEDPDILWEPDTPEELINELTEKNLIIYFLPDRGTRLWLGESPPERDLELGIGKYVAWQTPIHREAVRRVLME